MSKDEADKELVKMLSMAPADLDVYFKNLPPDGTSTKLVADLEKKPACAARDKLIQLAKDYWYDDFRSTNEDALCPKMALHDDLIRIGYFDLASKVTRGDYDRA